MGPGGGSTGGSRGGALTRRLERLRADVRGGVTITFALVAIFVLIPFVVVSLNAFIVVGQRSKLRDALDAATLFVAGHNVSDPTEINTLGKTALVANLELVGADAKLVTSSFTLVSGEGPDRIVSSATVKPWTPVDWCHVHSGDPWCYMARNITLGTEVVRAVDKIEVALVLDNTGSMAQDSAGVFNAASPNSRISILRVEAAKLVDSLAGIAKGDSKKVKISLVPFAHTVRVTEGVDLDGYDPTKPYATPGLPSWINPVGHGSMGGNGNGNGQGGGGGAMNIFDYAADRFALMKSIGVDWKGCVETRYDDYDIEDDPPGGQWKSLWTPYFWPDEVDANAANNPYKNSYLEDVDPSAYASGNDAKKIKAYQDEQKKTAKYLATEWHAGRKGATFDPGGDIWLTAKTLGGPFYYGPNAGCELQPIIPLTGNSATVKTAIGKMTAIGQTHIPMGLVWGWHTLSPNTQGPYGGNAEIGAAYSQKDVKKFVILMTDGDNTSFPYFSFDIDMTYNSSYYGGYGYIWQKMVKGLDEKDSISARQDAIDARMLALCDNIKDTGITIYTVGVIVSANAKEKLAKCASKVDGKSLYFDVAATKDLGPVFQQVANHISQMRIVR